MKKTGIIATILSISLFASIVKAEDIPTFDKEAFMASANVKTVLKIGMVDCVAMALKNNSEILVKQISPKIEDANVLVQRAKFEPAVTFDFLMEDDTELSPTTLIGSAASKVRTGTFNLGYDQTLVTGTKLDINFYNTRTTSNSAIQILNPEFDSQAAVTVTQPLLKGFGIIVNKADFLIAKNNKLKSVQSFTQDVIKILTDVKKRYYEFQYTQEQYKVALASLKRSEDLHYINKEKYIKGLASNVDLLQSEAEVARMQQATFAAENAMKLAEDNLKLITNLVDDVELWNANIILLDEISYRRYELDLIGAINTAFEYRPDYEAAKIDLKNKDISVIFYRNGVLPTLDLIGSYGLNGLGKTFEKDMGNLGDGMYPDWIVGVNVRLPLGSQKERGEYEKSKLDKKRALIAFKRLEQDIILQVRDAVRTVDTRYKMLEASLTAMKAQEENFAAQETRFKAGLVSTHDIIDYQERLALSEVNYAKSVIDYNISLVELSKQQGVTLIEDGISIEKF